MSIFINIETKLEEIAKDLDAIISKDRPVYPEKLRTFEERRIDWIEQGINKAIIIQPTFEYSGVNSDLWNFVLIAWMYKSGGRIQFIETLVSKSDFSKIEANIDALLKEGKTILLAKKLDDLKRPTWN